MYNGGIHVLRDFGLDFSATLSRLGGRPKAGFNGCEGCEESVELLQCFADKLEVILDVHINKMKIFPLH